VRKAAGVGHGQGQGLPPMTPVQVHANSRRFARASFKALLRLY
jgi:hypothetical protein